MASSRNGSWNYRVGAKVVNGTILYSIYEVYYTNGVADGYVVRNPLANWEDYADLIGTYNLIQGALSKPVIDMDNFPQEIKPEV